MRRLLFVVAAIMLPGLSAVRAQTFSWARAVAVGQFGQSVGYDVAVAPAGEAFVVGFVGGQIDFDGDGTVDYTHDFDSPVLLRYDASGTLLWHRAIKTALGGQGRAVALDGQGGVFVTGYVGETADFDGDGTFDLPRRAQMSYVFTARYNAAGALQWVRATCGGQGNGLAVDPADGSVVVTGSTAFCTDFDGDGRADDDLARGVFTVKYDAEGRLLWKQLPRAEEGDGGASVAVDASGNIYVGGTTQSTADFSGDGTADLTAPNFVVKYDADGAFQWVRGIAPTEFSDGVQAVAVAGTALYVGGAVAGAVDFSGDGTADLTTATGSVGDLFVARYALDGTLQWVRGAGGGGGTLSVTRALSADAAGVYATGFLSGRVDFNGDRVPDVQRGIELFVAHYLPDGTFAQVWAPLSPTTAFFGKTEGYGIGRDAQGHVYLTGLFEGEPDFSGDGRADLATTNFAWFTARYTSTSTAAHPEASVRPLAVHVVPVPFGDAATVTIETEVGQAVRVVLYDLSGRVVRVLHEGPAAGSPLRLDGHGLASGTYLLRVSTPEGGQVTRLVHHVRGR